MPKLTIEYSDHSEGGTPACYLTRILVDGVPIGAVQSLSYVEDMEAARPVIAIGQTIYLREGLVICALLRSIPGIQYTPTFMNGDGSTVLEEDFAPQM